MHVHKEFCEYRKKRNAWVCDSVSLFKIDDSKYNLFVKYKSTTYLYKIQFIHIFIFIIYNIYI